MDAPNSSNDLNDIHPQTPGHPTADTEPLSTFFDLGPEFMSALDFNELPAKIPILMASLARFNLFSVYLLDEG